MPQRAAMLDQTMMPTIAPPTVVRFTACGSIIPLPIVVATAVPDSTPMRLNTDATANATRGDSERVPTTVAIARSIRPAVHEFGCEDQKKNGDEFRLIVLSSRVSHMETASLL